MPFVSSLTPELTNKKTGDLIKAADWNTLATEVANLSNSMLGRDGGGVEGDLHVQGALAVDGATALRQELTVAGLARLQGELSVSGNGAIGGALHVQGDLTVAGAVRAPVFLSTSRMVHRMYPAKPLIYEDIFEAFKQGVIAKLGTPRLEDDWNGRHTAANPYRLRPLLQLGSPNDSDGNGAVVTVPEGDNTLWLRLHANGAGLKAYFLDGAGGALGHWSSGRRPYQVCPDGSLPDNTGAAESYDHQWLAIPVGRAGKVALISQQSEGYVWYSGVAFSRNPWAHAAQSARGYALGFNGSRGVSWHSFQFFGDQAGSIAPPNSGASFALQWGSQGSGQGQFQFPTNVVVDSRGNVYVNERVNCRIQKFDSNGRYLIQWGGKGSGNGQFDLPQGLAVDSSGNVYVVDRNNHRVQKFNSNGGYLMQWGSQGSDNGQFQFPTGVAVDSSGSVYVADLGNRVQKFNSNGGYLMQWGSRSPGSGNGQFKEPHDVAVDSSSNAYVVDYGNHRVQKFNSNGGYLTQWGSQGSGNGQFQSPTAVAVDSRGSIYVADMNNHRIQKFNKDGGYLMQWGSPGSGNGQFNMPHGVAVDSSGSVYVADMNNHRIQKFSQGDPVLQVPVIPNGRDKLFYLVNAPQLKDETTYDNGLQLTGLRVNGQPVERFLATYDNPFARYWNSRPGCNYNAALVPAELIPADARFLSVEIDLSKQYDDIKFREIGTHDLDVPLTE
jgi:DNA-binding beta-propeller fold protein YncE